jgi:hypothetical protein
MKFGGVSIGGRVGDILGGLVLGGPTGAIAGGVAGDKLKDLWYSFSGRAARDQAEVQAAQARADAADRQKYIDNLVSGIQADYGVGPDDAAAVKSAQDRIDAAAGAAGTIRKYRDSAGGMRGILRSATEQALAVAPASAEDFALVARANKAKAAKEAIERDDAGYEDTFRDQATQQAREGYSQGLLNIRRRLAGQGLLGGSLDSNLSRRLLEGYIGERQRAVTEARTARKNLEAGRFNTRMDLEKRAQAGDLLNTRWDDIQRQTQAGINQGQAQNMPQAFGESLAAFGKGAESYQNASDQQRRRDELAMPSASGSTSV